LGQLDRQVPRARQDRQVRKAKQQHQHLLALLVLEAYLAPLVRWVVQAHPVQQEQLVMLVHVVPVVWLVFLVLQVQLVQMVQMVQMVRMVRYRQELSVTLQRSLVTTITTELASQVATLFICTQVG